MEKVAPVYNVNSRASMAISTSMDSFLNINKCQHLLQSLRFGLASLYRKMVPPGQLGSSCSLWAFFLNTIEENLKIK